MTIDTLFGKRLYLLIVLELKSRKIVLWDLIEHPVMEFVKQRVMRVNTCLAAPNMNAFTERVI